MKWVAFSGFAAAAMAAMRSVQLLSRRAAVFGGSRGFSVRSTAASGSVVYESSRAVEEYLAFHYSPKETAMPYNLSIPDALDFPARMAAIAAKHSLPERRKVAYDVGCSVGRGTFEMTKTFDKVVGVDFSHAFIDAANEVKTGEPSYEVLEQGSLRTQHAAKLPAGCDASKAQFRQGDACNLGDIGEVDCITAVNLLCRLPEPQAFLQKACECIRPGGLLVLVSPFSWLEEYTAPEKWFGGKLDAAGQPIDSHGAVAKVLDPHFELVARSDEAFLLREHVRKFQFGVSDCTVWRKK